MLHNFFFVMKVNLEREVSWHAEYGEFIHQIRSDFAFQNICEFLFTLKFIYSEKATNFFEILTVDVTTVHTVKVRGRFPKILWPSQNI